MKLFRQVKSLGLVILVMAAVLVQPLMTSSGRAEEKAPASAVPGNTAEFQVPKGTMDAVTAIMTRRSIRDYSPHPVPAELLQLLVEAGMCAPSAFNERTQEFIVINDRKVLDAIFNLNPKALQLKKASVAIMICGNQEREKFKGQGYWQLDGSVAAENILLAAHAVGLGAVWTAIYPYPDRVAAVKKLLNLPEQVQPLCIIPIGYPGEQKAKENRFESSRLHTNRW
jgi:nitroreductase